MYVFKKSSSGSLFFTLKRQIFHFPCFFEKHDFELKVFLRVTFWIEKSTTRHVLNLKEGTPHVLDWKIYNVFAKFSCVHQNRARLGNVLMYGVGSVSQVILLG